MEQKMARTCTVCTHPDRAAIDQALVVDKLSFRDIARQWRVSKDAIARHQAHIPEALTKAQEAKQVAQADTLLGEVRTAKGRSEKLYEAALQILQQALDSKDPKLALQAIRSAVDVLRAAQPYMQLKGQLTGELNGTEGGARQVVIVLPARREAGSPCPTTMAVELPPEYLAMDAEFEDIPPANVESVEGPERKMLPWPGEDEEGADAA